MKVLFSWVKDYLEPGLSFEEFKAKITRLGFGIDSAEKTGVDAENVFTAEILKIEKHPNADRLSLCEVSTGDKIYKVVCGAKNIEVGQKIPFAVIGARLPEGVLKKAKIRGVESEGMICSAAELGLKGYDSEAVLAEGKGGILPLDKNLPLGADIREVFPKADYVFELEITPNLAYCLSHYALARELSVFYGLTLREPCIPSFDNEGAPVIKIEIEDPKNCHRYAGIVMKGVKNKKTPEYMYDRLKAIGLNPKGDVLIDVTNYVMFELGQPIHCFDLRNIRGGEIRVRQAGKGEKIKTLDGREQELSEEVMVIADGEKPVAVAGVMGGFYSSINPDTEDVLIESALFDPPAVRKSSKIVKIKSDSSYRFERGVDPELQLKAALRVAGILKELNSAAEIAQISDSHPFKKEPAVIEISHEKINSVLGSSLEKGKIDACLKAIDPSFGGRLFTAPSYRGDLKNIWDVAEEVARYIGYDVIESRTSMPLMKVAENGRHAMLNEFKNGLSACGLSEVCNYDLISLKEIRDMLSNENEAVELKNPLSSDFHYLRPALPASLMKNLKYNLNRGRNSVCIYESGSVFAVRDGKPEETRQLAGLLYGYLLDEEFWRGERESLDFYHVKGILNRVFYGYGDFAFEKPEKAPHYFREASCLALKISGETVGYAGLLNPQIISNFDLKDNNVFYFEVNLEKTLKHFETEFYKKIRKIKPVSQFQHSWRDLSVLLDRKYSWGEVHPEISGIPELLWVKLVDVYTGKNIPEDLKSLTIRFMFSSMEKTFTDQELNKLMEGVFKKLQDKFQAVLRS